MLYCALLLSAALTFSGTAWPLTVEDDRGVMVTLKAPAGRVVSLAPFLAELVFAVGRGDRLVAVSEYSDYPPVARDLPRIGDAFSVNLEAVLALRPDLVLAWQSGNDPRVGDRFEAMGIPVFVLEPREIDDVPSALRRVGRLLGAGRVAEDRARAFSEAIEAVRSEYSGRKTVRVFYQVARNPLVTLNGSHMFTAVLDICGGTNVFGELGPVAPTVNREQVLARDPEAILISSTIRNASELIDYWSRYPSLTATRLDNLFLVDSDLINRQTPRLIEGALQICGHLERAREKLSKDRRGAGDEM